MLVISGVPGKEMQFDRMGNPLEGPKRRRRRAAELADVERRKKDINEMAGSVRALCQGNCAPNHYWDMKTNSQDQKALFDQMEREVKLYGIDSLEVVLPHRSGPQRQRLPARRREDDLSVL